MKEETNHILGQFQLKHILYSKTNYQRNAMTTTLWKHCPTIRSWDKKNDETSIQVEEIQRNQDQKMHTSSWVANKHILYDKIEMER